MAVSSVADGWRPTRMQPLSSSSRFRGASSVPIADVRAETTGTNEEKEMCAALNLFLLP